MIVFSSAQNQFFFYHNAKFKLEMYLRFGELVRRTMPHGSLYKNENKSDTFLRKKIVLNL